MNQLILGDNLEILKGLESDRIDLIYLDPPFFSNRNYEVIWGDAGEIRSFQDRWSGGIEHYIGWLKERVVEMYRLLKPTGSIFLHCDWHADAYIRVLILDKVFGEQNFINHFVWKRSSNRSSISRAARKNHDTLFFYSKTGKYAFNQLFTSLSEESMKLYRNKDDKGYYRFVPLTVSGKRKGKTGQVWKGIDPNKLGQSGMHWVTIPEKLDDYDKQGLVYFGKDGTGVPQLKYYLEDNPGVPIGEIWDDIKLVSGGEGIGYPTQKPEALLERIIQCASNEGDVVLDPFLGGGTTVAVADRLKRQWLGIDQSVQAIKVSELRLHKQRDLFSSPFVVQLHKYDYDTLRSSDAFEFESWIIQQYGGIANVKQRGDFGLDGRTTEGLPIQVKRSDNVGRNVIDNFQAACKRFDNALFDKNQARNLPIGVIIAFSFGKGAIQEVARLTNHENLIIQLVTVAEIVPIAKKPKLSLKFTDLGLDHKGLREIEWEAQGESEAGIEFYAWDFSYDSQEGFKADVLIDKVGKQVEKFKAGNHQVAVKVVDNEGLESVEVIELKVNGNLHRSN